MVSGVHPYILDEIKSIISKLATFGGIVVTIN